MALPSSAPALWDILPAGRSAAQDWAGKTPYVVVCSILLPAVLAAVLFLGQRRPTKARGDAAAGGGPSAEAGGRKARPSGDVEPTCLSEEPWCPKLVFRDWQQAGEVPGCPWDFGGCETLEDALRRIWCRPLPSDLESAFEALKERVRSLQVARMTVSFPREEVRYAAIYTLVTGAELFGGEPMEHQAPEESAPSSDAGLRQRGVGSQRGGRSARGQELGRFRLPSSLTPFYAIHDGFGVLLSTRHLPLLLCNPDDSVNGSCYYVYPVRGLEIVKQQPELFRFARVDRNCAACTRHREERASVAYVESTGETVEEEEAPLAFINDTVSNIAGQRVVPPSYLGGPGAFGVTACEGMFR